MSTDQSNAEVKQKERIKYKLLTFQGRPCSLTVICRFDVQREVRRGRIRSRAGRQESSAGASLTHVGQSSVEIRLMNRGERAKRRGYSSFNIPPSLSVGPALVCPPLEEGEAGRVSGWHIRTSEKDFGTREPRDKAPATDASCLISIENP